MSAFLINLLLALIWAMARGDFSLAQFALGFAVGFAVLYLTQPVMGRSAYFGRVGRLPAFALYFPEGTAAGEVEGTRSKAEIWQTPDDFLAKAQALTDAAEAVAATSDLAGQQAAMGPVGQACGACHEAYRVPDN